MTGRVRVRFIEAGGDHDVVAEEAVLPDRATHAVASSDLTMAMTRGEGRQVAERWLTEARVSRDTVRFALPPSKMALGAGDVVRFPADGGEGDVRYRIDRVEQSGLQLIEAVRIEPEVYTPSEIAEDAPGMSAFVPPVPVLPLFMDLPLITGDEIEHAPHLAVTASPWPGTVALYASNTDDNYVLSEIIAKASVIGVTGTAMTAHRPGLWDHGAPLEVKLVSGALETRDCDAVLNGANLAVIGDGTSGNWEVFQFSQADLIAPDTYWLSTRLRGQLGSDGLMPDVWPMGSWFVLFDGAAIQTNLTSVQRRIARNYRIGPARRGLDDPSYVHLVEAFDGNGLRPYSPAHLMCSGGLGVDMAFSWVRRTRIDGDDWELPDVPLGEERELYQVRVFQGVTVLREELVTVPLWDYPAADQASDGLVLPARVEVTQVSARYGEGLASGVDLEA